MKRIVLAVMWTLWTPVQAQDARSGYAYLGAETRALQDDDFANPGMFWVEYGLAIYQSREGADESSCASCHGEPESLRGASTHYPRIDGETAGIINLEGRINRCRTEQMQLDAVPYESEILLALTTLVAHQSRGLPMNVEVAAVAEPFLEHGRRFYYQLSTSRTAPSLMRELPRRERRQALARRCHQPGPDQRLSDLSSDVGGSAIDPPHVRVVQRSRACRALCPRLQGISQPRALCHYPRVGAEGRVASSPALIRAPGSPTDW